MIAGAATRAEVAQSEVVVNVAGRVAIDLRLAGVIRTKPTLLQRLNPVPAARRLGGAWRIGRLRAALPVLAERLLDRVDDDLAAVPSLDELSSRQLVALFHRGHVVLRSLHAHEILMGILTDVGGNQMTGASIALRVLAEARREGLTDQDVLERSPVVLALTPPRVAPRARAPTRLVLGRTSAPTPTAPTTTGSCGRHCDCASGGYRSSPAAPAWELGVRLTRAGDLVEPEMIRHMTLDHVEAVFTKRAVVVARARADAPAQLRGAAAGRVPPHRPRQGHARTVRRRGRRWHRCRWRLEAGGRHLRPRRPARRLGARHRDAHTRSGNAAATPQRDRRRNRLGAVAPRDPGPRSERADGRRLRERGAGVARGHRGAGRRRNRTRHGHHRGDDAHETARLARRHRNPRRRRRQHARLAQSLGVEPRPLLLADRRGRRGRRSRPRSCSPS